MRRVQLSTSIVLVAMLSGNAAPACDCVAVGLGVRYENTLPAEHPASILIFMNPESAMPTVDRKVKLQSTLKL